MVCCSFSVSKYSPVRGGPESFCVWRRRIRPAVLASPRIPIGKPALDWQPRLDSHSVLLGSVSATLHSDTSYGVQSCARVTNYDYFISLRVGIRGLSSPFSSPIVHDGTGRDGERFEALIFAHLAVEVANFNLDACSAYPVDAVAARSLDKVRTWSGLKPDF